MWMRFDLYSAPAAAPGRAVEVPRFGVMGALPGRARRGFIYAKRVDQLPAGGLPRPCASAGTTPTAPARRRRAPRAPAASPTAPGPHGRHRHGRRRAARARCATRPRAQRGRSDVGRSTVALAVGDGRAAAAGVASPACAAGATRCRRDAPRCAPGPAVQVALDPGRRRRVDEADERDTRRSRALPDGLIARLAATLVRAMKTEIHPEYVEAHVRCTCGNEFTTRSTKPEIHVEICSNCHPFYTGGRSWSTPVAASSASSAAPRSRKAP